MTSSADTYPDKLAASDVTAAPVIVLLGGAYDGRMIVGSVAVRLHAPLTNAGEFEAEIETEEVASPTSDGEVGYMLDVVKPELAAIPEVLFLVGNGTRTSLETPAFPDPVPMAAVARRIDSALRRKAQISHHRPR